LRLTLGEVFDERDGQVSLAHPRRTGQVDEPGGPLDELAESVELGVATE
jgi:hypothetical protein